MTQKWGRAMGEDDDENIAGGRAGGHRRRLVPALVLVACVLLGQACICDAQLSPSSDIATARKDEGGECCQTFFQLALYFYFSPLSIVAIYSVYSVENLAHLNFPEFVSKRL